MGLGRSPMATKFWGSTFSFQGVEILPQGNMHSVHVGFCVVCGCSPVSFRSNTVAQGDGAALFLASIDAVSMGE